MSGLQRILMHVCCGPCAIYPVQKLQKAGIEVTGLFYNPNIHPLQEYLRRREGAVQVAKKLGIRLICLDKEYSVKNFLRQVVFREENRCRICYHLRLEKTWLIAKKGGFDYFCTTMLYSKQQEHNKLANLAKDIAGEDQVGFYYQDFRPGWKEGIRLSQEWGIYRQNYCGCIYSESERFAKLLEEKAE